MWTQLEFDFDKVVRRDTDYELLAHYIEEKGEVTFHEIAVLTDCTSSATSQVIDTLSLRYPLWSPRRGVYKMLTREDREEIYGEESESDSLEEAEDRPPDR